MQPGFKKEEVNLELKDVYLTIQAAKGLDKEEPEKKGKYIRQERYSGACSRACIMFPMWLWFCSLGGGFLSPLSRFNCIIPPFLALSIGEC